MMCLPSHNSLVAIVDACLLLTKASSTFYGREHSCTPAAHIVIETIYFLLIFLVRSLIDQYQTSHIMNPLRDLVLSTFSRWLERVMCILSSWMRCETDSAQLLPICFLRNM